VNTDMHVVVITRRGLSSHWIREVVARTQCKHLLVMLDDDSQYRPIVPDVRETLCNIEIIDADRRQIIVNNLRARCMSPCEDAAFEFFLSPPSSRWGLCRLRNLSEAYLQVLLSREGADSRYPVMSLDDDVLPPGNMGSLMDVYTGKGIVFGGYFGQPPFRMYWHDALGLGRKRLAELIVQVNFSDDVDVSTFRDLVFRVLENQRFDHRRIYKPGVYQKTHFMGGTHVRPKKTLSLAPCPPMECRGYDDVFQGKMLSRQGISISFVPHATFLHRRRQGHYTQAHVLDALRANDLLTLLDTLDAGSDSSHIHFDARISCLEEQRRISYDLRVGVLSRLLGWDGIYHLPSCAEICAMNTALCCEWEKHVSHFHKIMRRPDCPLEKNT